MNIFIKKNLMKKNILNEINRYREIMGLGQLLNEGNPKLSVIGDIILNTAKTEGKDILGKFAALSSDELDDLISLSKLQSLTDSETVKLESLITKFQKELSFEGIQQVSKSLKNLDVLEINKAYDDLVKLANDGKITKDVFNSKVETLLATTKEEITDPKIEKEVFDLYRELPSKIKKVTEIVDDLMVELETKFPGIFVEQETGILIKKNIPVYKKQIEQLRSVAEKQLKGKTKEQALNELKTMANGIRRDIDAGNLPPAQKNALKKFMEDYPKLFKTAGIFGIGALLLFFSCVFKPSISYCMAKKATETAIDVGKGVVDPLKNLGSDSTLVTPPTNTTTPQTNTVTTQSSTGILD